MPMTELHLNHPSIVERSTVDFAETRQITDATKRLYDGAAMVPYDEELFRAHDVKRGLRNADGSGVVAGLTRISDVHGYCKDANGTVIPDEGKLTICGYDIAELVSNAQQEGRFGYEEVVFLLLTGELPRQDELDALRERIAGMRRLPSDYIREFPMTTKSKSIMNVLARAVLLLYAFDETPDDIDPAHEVDVALSLIARLPRIAAIAHTLRRAEFEGRRAHIPLPNNSYSMAETILQVLREGDDFTRDEAMLLDVMLMLHAEHGGGNNSTFACRVLSSSATDAYSAYAAAIGSLKGPRHGGANSKVMAMHADIREHVRRWDDDGEIAGYLTRILNREAFDGAGLIYGMGHAVYTRSDPRAVLCRRYAAHLAERIHMTVPQDSLVGMLMDVPVTPQVVHSDAFGGIDQHSLFTWEVAGDDFAYVERVADASRTVHDAINEWLAAMEPRDVERVVEALFAAAAASGAADARAFLRLGPDTLKSVREAARRIDDASREILSQALGDLAAIAVRRAGRDVAAALFGE